MTVSKTFRFDEHMQYLLEKIVEGNIKEIELLGHSDRIKVTQTFAIHVALETEFQRLLEEGHLKESFSNITTLQ